jgi:hypothetical protein
MATASEMPVMRARAGLQSRTRPVPVSTEMPSEAFSTTALSLLLSSTRAA